MIMQNSVSKGVSKGEELIVDFGKIVEMEFIDILFYDKFKYSCKIYVSLLNDKSYELVYDGKDLSEMRKIKIGKKHLRYIKLVGKCEQEPHELRIQNLKCY